MQAAATQKAMNDYYGTHHVFPADNVAAGLAQSTSISGRYVSGVNVAGGVVTITFDTENADQTIRQQSLVLLPVVTNGRIVWDCSTYSTVGAKYLPTSCRK